MSAINTHYRGLSNATRRLGGNPANIAVNLDPSQVGCMSTTDPERRKMILKNGAITHVAITLFTRRHTSNEINGIKLLKGHFINLWGELATKAAPYHLKDSQRSKFPDLLEKTEGLDFFDKMIESQQHLTLQQARVINNSAEDIWKHRTPFSEACDQLSFYALAQTEKEKLPEQREVEVDEETEIYVKYPDSSISTCTVITLGSMIQHIPFEKALSLEKREEIAVRTLREFKLRGRREVTEKTIHKTIIQILNTDAIKVKEPPINKMRVEGDAHVISRLAGNSVYDLDGKDIYTLFKLFQRYLRRERTSRTELIGQTLTARSGIEQRREGIRKKHSNEFHENGQQKIKEWEERKARDALNINIETPMISATPQPLSPEERDTFGTLHVPQTARSAKGGIAYEINFAPVPELDIPGIPD